VDRGSVKMYGSLNSLKILDLIVDRIVWKRPIGREI
jgi:hypothetical protein